MFQWRKRYFRLWSDKTLEYYKNATDTKPWREPIALSACMGIMDTKEELSKYLKKTKYKFSFGVLTALRLYHLATTSAEERDVWKKHISDVCEFGADMRPPVNGKPKS